MHRYSPIVVMAVAIVVSLVAGSVRSGEEDSEARMQFTEGIRLFKDGDFEGASIAFNRAYELRPSYKILYNVGQVENELKHYCLALAAYEEYLEAGGEAIDPERKNEVAEHIKRLQIRVGSVEIKYNRDGTTVMIDEQRYGVTPLQEPICVDMGNHDLSLREGVKEIYRETFRIAGGQALTLDLNAEEKEPAPIPAPAAVVEPPKDEPPPREDPPEPQEKKEPIQSEQQKTEDSNQESPSEPKQEKRKRKWTWVALGTSGAAGIAGGVIGGISRSKELALKGRCSDYVCEKNEQNTKDSIKRLNLTADILFGVAGATAVTGIVLFFVEPRRSESPTVGVTPIGGSNHAGISIEGRF